jgi:hypothetical protein
VVEYETVVFTGGLRGDTSKFLGSSKEVDDQWDELYNSMSYETASFPSISPDIYAP